MFLPLTCQMLTIFSMAEAKYFPVTLHARGDKQGSLGEPRPDMPSSEEPSLRTEEHTDETKAYIQLHSTEISLFH